VSATTLVKLRLVPVTIVITGVVCATILSLSMGSSAESLSSEHSLNVWRTGPLFGISCPSATDCVAVGWGASSSATLPSFAVSESNGHWGPPTLIAGSAGSPGGTLNDVSCSAVGECIASSVDAVLVVEHKGHWSGDISERIPPLANTPIETTSCSQMGLCWAISENFFQGGLGGLYAVGVKDGRWIPPHRLDPPPTPGATPERASPVGVSCWSRTSCTFLGGANVASESTSPQWRQFVQTETNGVWSPAQWVPPDADSSTGGLYSVFVFQESFTCVSRGTCSIGGFGARGEHSIATGAVEQEIDGKWMPTVVGFGRSPTSSSYVVQVACHSISLCVASGGSDAPSGGSDGSLFFRAQVHGKWQSPYIVPTKNRSFLDYGSVPTAAACPTPSTCYVVGRLTTVGGQQEAFVARFDDGKWSLQQLYLSPSVQRTAIQDLSCTSSECWAVGYSIESNGFTNAFAFELVPPSQ
jgi:hypothetical protein